MGSALELANAWETLTEPELQAIVYLSQRTSSLSLKLSQFLGSSVLAEIRHREDLATKPEQAPDWELFDDFEVAGAYTACVAIERAAGVSERLGEWAELLRRSCCNEMSARLRVRQFMKESQCDRN